MVPGFIRIVVVDFVFNEIIVVCLMSDFFFRLFQILEDLKGNSTWNSEASEEENNEGSWYRFLSAARGMLHQYTGQQYSNINGHYSPLNSCSQLVQQTYSQVVYFFNWFCIGLSADSIDIGDWEIFPSFQFGNILSIFLDF